MTDSVPVLRREADARQALAELKGVANIIPNQAILINAIALREAKDSSEIENIATTQDRLYRAIATSSSAGVDASTKEVMQYRSALRVGEALVRDHGFLSVNHIIRIQTEIIGDDAGLRATPGTALVNDRTGRILNVLYLILKRYLEIPILYPSSYIIEHKDEYYGSLRGVTAAGEWEAWILFMLDAIQATSVDTIERVREIRVELDRAVDEVRAALPRIYTKDLVETLFVHPYSKIEFLVNAWV